MYNDLMISVDELWLKGRNRPLYFKALIKHVNQVLKLNHRQTFSMKNDSQRLTFSSDVGFSDETIFALTKIPGISLISPVRFVKRTENDIETLDNLSKALIDECHFFQQYSEPFRVVVKRNDKRFTISSMDVERRLGKDLLDYYPNARAHLKDFRLLIDVRVLPEKISICTRKYPGIGGLPWGSSGTAVTMLSGGFDSPVASFMMAKRGLRQSFVFFHAYPFVGDEVVDKIKKLTQVLATYQRQSHLYIIPFGDIQNAIAKSCHEEYRTILFRKYMILATNLLCDRIGAQAIITGDSLGQVSSQTLTNLSLIDKTSDKIILRPLVGFNKLEVIRLAEKIGTHDISVIPHDDACALFAPENPVTNANITYWREHEAANDLTELLNKAIDTAGVYSVNALGELYKKDYFSFDS